MSWYFDHIYSSMICIPVSQFAPSNPTTQVQPYPLPTSSHVAPFWHGVLSHWLIMPDIYNINLSQRKVRYDSNISTIPIYLVHSSVCGELGKAVNTFKFHFHRRFLCCFVYVRVQVPRVLCNIVYEESCPVLCNIVYE